MKLRKLKKTEKHVYENNLKFPKIYKDYSKKNYKKGWINEITFYFFSENLIGSTSTKISSTLTLNFPKIGRPIASKSIVEQINGYSNQGRLYLE